jgi:hypothetical protein
MAVNGSVFIVTKGGNSVKLGLVKVEAFDANDLAPLIAAATYDQQAQSLGKPMASVNAELQGLLKPQLNCGLQEGNRPGLLAVIVNSGCAPATQAVTDADGKFTLHLVPGRKYWLYATASRSVLDQIESYVWCIEYTANTEQELYLSNDNLVAQ